METGAQLLKPGVETGLVIYDMNGFGLSNMVRLLSHQNFIGILTS